ncbi:MAG: GGDEF domain-containing protein [Clostridiales bacterium]|nr:GGDEF domain-containing protein [Clostridiales bacterium]
MSLDNKGLNMIISRQNLSDIIRYSSVIFDHSRIVNDNRTRELVVLDDGNVKEQDFVCTWSDSTCDKCQYQRDEFEDKVSNKIEIVNGEFRHVVNVPLDIDGEKWFFQLMTCISNVISDANFKGDNIVELFDKYNKQLYMDSLTDIYNRRYYEEKLLNLETANGAAMLDIDNFKMVNDTYGHKIGDYVLKAIASVIKDNIRNSDAAVRYGGDEFFILFWNIPKDVLRLKLEKILECIRQIQVPEYPELKISASIGFVHRVDLTEKLLVDADTNLYKAKAVKDCLVTNR